MVVPNLNDNPFFQPTTGFTHHREGCMISMNRRTAAFGLAAFLASSVAHATSWDVRARGRLVYRNGSVWTGVPGVKVKVQDADGIFTETMGEGWTDANGYFDVPGRGGDDQWLFCDSNCSKPDTFVQVVLGNDRVEVATELGFTWHADTPEHGNTAGVIDFGTFAFSSADGSNAEALFATEMQQYTNFQRLMGGAQIPGVKATVSFPALLAAGVPWTDTGTTHWPGSYTDWSVVYHEFGHRIRHAADGDFFHFLGDVAAYSYMQQHTFDKVTNPGYAFNEGWAEYHATLLDGGLRSYFLGWRPATGGDSTEGNVAQKLLHLSDLCGGFPSMWAALTSRQIHSYAEFEAAMRAKFPNCFRVTPPITIKDRPIPLVHMKVLPLVDQSTSVAKMVALVPVSHVQAKLVPVKAATPQQVPLAEVFNRLVDVRKLAFTRSLDAAHAAYRKHYLALKPIGPENQKGGLYRQQLQDSRAAFLKEALGPQLEEVGKVMGEFQKERNKVTNKELHPYLDAQLKRHAKRQEQLRRALATRPSPEMSIPVDLLPRGFAQSTAPAK